MITCLLFAADQVKPSIHVSGLGEVAFAPNIAFLTVGMEDVYANVQEGQNAVSEKINKFQQSLEGIITIKDIETAVISIQRRYSYNAGKEEFQGYAIKQTLKIKVNNFKNIGLVVDKAVSCGLNSLGSLAFSHTTPAAYNQKALQIALLDANKKSEIIGKTMGLANIKVEQISENSSLAGVAEQPMYRGMALASLVDASATQVVPGELKVTVRVNVDYSFK